MAFINSWDHFYVIFIWFKKKNKTILLNPAGLPKMEMFLSVETMHY